MENKRFFLYFGLLGFFVMFYNNFYLIKDVMVDGKNVYLDLCGVMCVESK